LPLRLLADAGAQTTIPGVLTSGATSFVGASTANFASPQSFANGQGSLTILDQGNPAWNPATPLATPYEYAYYTNNNTGTNTISGLTRGVAGTTGHGFFAGALVAQGILAEDIYASVPWKFDDQLLGGPGASIVIPSSGSIPASYLGATWRGIRIRWSLLTTSGNHGDFVQMRFNGDTAANYDYQALVGAAAAASATSSGSATSFRVGSTVGGLGTAGHWGQGWIEIFDAFNTVKMKTFIAACYSYDGGSAITEEMDGGNWHTSASPITSITLFPSAGNFATNCLVTTELLP
jgi:hypothetical protein